jgi:hypothetical protein
MRTQLLIIFGLLFIASCRNNNQIPSGVIPPKQMQAVLWDLMRADMFLGDFVFRTDSSLDKKKEKIKLYGQVFAIHHINKDEFGESFSFYKTHPALLNAIMDSLSRPKTEAPTEMVKQPLIADTARQPGPGSLRTDSISPVRKRKINIAD